MPTQPTIYMYIYNKNKIKWIIIIIIIIIIMLSEALKIIHKYENKKSRFELIKLVKYLDRQIGNLRNTN